MDKDDKIAIGTLVGAWCWGIGLGMIVQSAAPPSGAWWFVWLATCIFGGIVSVLSMAVVIATSTKVLDLAQAASEALEQRRIRRKEKIEALRDKFDPAGALIRRLDGDKR